MNNRRNDAHIIQTLRSQTLARSELSAAAAPLREAAVFAGVLEHLPIFHMPGDRLAGDFGWRPEDDAALCQRFPVAPAASGAPVAAMTPEARMSVDFHCFGGYSAAHTCIGYGKILRLGVDGLLAELDAAGGGPYRRIMSTALLALVALAERYAELLEQQGETELSRICRKVPRQPADNFLEALQSIWFAHLAIGISEYSDASISLGRFDQYAWPFYRRSLETGIIVEDLEEQFAALVKKLNSYGDAACALNLGGLDDSGNDLCNPLTRMVIRVVKAQKRPAPILAARIHPRIPQDVFDALIDPDLFAVGQPTFYGEASCRAALRERGVPEPELSRWAANSCMGLVIEGCEVSNMWGGVVNFLLPLELAVNNGRPFHKQLPITLNTVAECGFSTFEELYAKFIDYLGELTGFCIRNSQASTARARTERPNPYLSAVLNHCIARGADRLDGGAAYYTTIIEGFGLINAADALHAVKTLVFDRRTCSLAELVAAAVDGFQSRRDLLLQVRNVPKYGNGDPDADAFAASLADAFQQMVRSYSTPANGYAPSFHTLNAHVGAGKKYGASLDGRLSGEPLAKNIGSSPGAAVGGLTALIRSAAAINQAAYFGGQALDVSIAAPMVKSEHDKRKIQALIQTYFRLGGLQLQVNGLDAETLREAIDNPEAHRDLIVRIGGYSDYFNNLGMDVRQEMAKRFADGL